MGWVQTVIQIVDQLSKELGMWKKYAEELEKANAFLKVFPIA